MNNTETISDDSRKLISFFFLAYALSWSIGIPLALTHQGIIPPIFPQWTHYLIAFGPMLSALIVTGVSQGATGMKELGKRIIRWACPKWWLVAISPLFIGFVVVKIMNGLTASEIAMSDLGAVNYLPPMGMWALLFWILTFGLGEETGWRGFALPRLQKGRSALGATLILATLWTLWHLPQFFYVFDPSMAIGWLIGLFAGAVVLTWLYNSSTSILMVAVWHGCFNFVTASAMDTGVLPVVVSVIVILMAVAVLVRYKPKNLISL
jgi:membrane protease YdiL (CAAX protease family)